MEYHLITSTKLKKDLLAIFDENKLEAKSIRTIFIENMSKFSRKNLEDLIKDKDLIEKIILEECKNDIITYHVKGNIDKLDKNICEIVEIIPIENNYNDYMQSKSKS